MFPKRRRASCEKIPKIFSAATRIKIEQERPAVSLTPEGQSIPSYDPYFLQTQYEILQSQKVLHPVNPGPDIPYDRAEIGFAPTAKTPQPQPRIQIRPFDHDDAGVRLGACETFQIAEKISVGLFLRGLPFIPNDDADGRFRCGGCRGFATGAQNGCRNQSEGCHESK